MIIKLKKLLMGLAALAALAFGGAQLAGATGSGSSVSADSEEHGEQGERSDAADSGDEGEHRGEHVSGADADRAKASAEAAVPGGKAGDVSAENPADDRGEAADKPEPGDHPDPAYESRIAYDVEVTKADGSEVDVHLDKAFKVLGTEAGDQHHGAEDQEGE